LLTAYRFQGQGRERAFFGGLPAISPAFSKQIPYLRVRKKQGEGGEGGDTQEPGPVLLYKLVKVSLLVLASPVKNTTSG